MKSAPSVESRITHQVVERKVGDLSVDPNVQRSVKPSRVKELADDFNPAALGVLTTSHRSPHQIHIVDGQHRYLAAEKATYKGVIQTMEYKGLTVPEEAALFRQLNNTRTVSAIDRFLVSCVEQNPDALRLSGYINVHGWALGASASDGKLSAIGSLERVYAKSPEAADSALAVLTTAYGHRPAAVAGSLLEGLGVMLARYNRQVDLDDLAKRLSGYAGGPEALLGHARGQKAARTGNLSRHVAALITDIYNARRRSTALPAWE